MPPRSSRRKSPIKAEQSAAVIDTVEDSKLEQEITIGEASDILRPQLRDPQQAPQLVQRVVSIVQSHSGPLPPPQMLGGYDAVVPGSAKMIVDMAASEHVHRHRKEWAEIIFPYVGMVLGAAILIFCVWGSIYLAMAGHDKVAAALVALPVIGAVGFIIKSRIPSSSQDQPQQKAAARPRKRK